MRGWRVAFSVAPSIEEPSRDQLLAGNLVSSVGGIFEGLFESVLGFEIRFVDVVFLIWAMRCRAWAFIRWKFREIFEDEA